MRYSSAFQGLVTLGVAVSLLVGGWGIRSTHGDEPSRLARLFRMGGSSSNAKSTASTSPVPAPAPSSASETMIDSPPISTPPVSSSGTTVAPRVVPRSRVSKPPTEADPLVTRISLGRSDAGSQFGMFLQVFADGTIIDGEGVHRVGPAALRPVVEAVSDNELGKVKGHCGGPAGDFIETVHVVVFDRAYGRLRANSFSYSGNTQGCDHAVHHLNKVLDDLQTKISANQPAAPAPAPAIATTPRGALAPPLPLTEP